jgi:hypothetical protein
MANERNSLQVTYRIEVAFMRRYTRSWIRACQRGTLSSLGSIATNGSGIGPEALRTGIDSRPAMRYKVLGDGSVARA